MSDLLAALQTASSQYEAKNPRSRELHQDALKSLPGGNTRTLLYNSPFPLSIKSGRGHLLTTEDDQTLVDLTGEFTAGLYGHSNPVIIQAITDAMHNVGLNLSGTNAQEQNYARLLCDRFCLERVRFTNSGTEANLHALAAARQFTGKRKIVAFGGGYHGGVLGFAGNKPGPNNVDLDDWIVARYNDLGSAAEAINSPGVAAVIVEGMQGAGGCIVGSPEFLRGIQILAKQANVVFILDEVMTSRLAGHGLAELRGLKPDIKTLGKYLGGGLAFGAFGGRADIMAVFDPRDGAALPHSGTFNNNTLVTHAGYAGLAEVYTPEVAEDLTARGEALLAKLNEATSGTKLCFTGIGSVMACHFPRDGSREMARADEVEEDAALKDLFWFHMLDSGFWVARRGLVALILETPQQDLDRFVEAVKGFVDYFPALICT